MMSPSQHLHALHALHADRDAHQMVVVLLLREMEAHQHKPLTFHQSNLDQNGRKTEMGHGRETVTN
jgi:hypothetical protein